MGIEGFKERYVNPYTDFGFKKLFGTEMNKELLISFLNALLHGEQTVVDVTYLNNEHLGAYGGERRAIFDVYCENDRGEKFIVEMQNVYQQFFKDRSVFYATFPIREQAKRGDWDFRLAAVYTIGILNFVFEEDRYSPEYFYHRVMLMDVERKEVFYDKLTFIYLEIPKFNKTEDLLETMFDKWMFVLRNLTRLMERPAALQERVFEHMFRAAEIARFTPQELSEYEESVKAYRDIKNAVDTAHKEGFHEGHEEGFHEGREEEKKEIARKLKAMGLPAGEIAKSTGLSSEEIEKL
ncbi:Rpn family recombination-promoting nuclease/putative transposase [Parabacteroides sp. Marseille-P3160]|uniref:Rpn family recombination-promoting nuclease/putative transposase n=1 Tax=Parabacteroides sp. Marseille-P3160 TaxID=1917887 RepID=UPI0009BAE6C9|nr:Rpn family recombination-promoting nuclease/putative transposase [Parabacteroides sp. Marseille-P3160]